MPGAAQGHGTMRAVDTERPDEAKTGSAAFGRSSCTFPPVLVECVYAGELCQTPSDGQTDMPDVSASASLSR